VELGLATLAASAEAAPQEARALKVNAIRIKTMSMRVVFMESILSYWLEPGSPIKSISTNNFMIPLQELKERCDLTNLVL
jgi:hypothetical protein